MSENGNEHSVRGSARNIRKFRIRNQANLPARFRWRRAIIGKRKIWINEENGRLVYRREAIFSVEYNTYGLPVFQRDRFIYIYIRTNTNNPDLTAAVCQSARLLPPLLFRLIGSQFPVTFAYTGNYTALSFWISPRREKPHSVASWPLRVSVFTPTTPPFSRLFPVLLFFLFFILSTHFDFFHSQLSYNSTDERSIKRKKKKENNARPKGRMHSVNRSKGRFPILYPERNDEYPGLVSRRTIMELLLLLNVTTTSRVYLTLPFKWLVSSPLLPRSTISGYEMLIFSTATVSRYRVTSWSKQRYPLTDIHVPWIAVSEFHHQLSVFPFVCL